MRAAGIRFRILLLQFGIQDHGADIRYLDAAAGRSARKRTVATRGEPDGHSESTAGGGIETRRTAARLVFAPSLPNPQHLARFAAADLFLDTLPYNAHTLTSDALWGGCPVITCMGWSFAGRVAASLLRAVGLPEMVTDSLAAYEALARQLALDPDRLRAIRGRLAANRLTTPLFDSPRFTRHLESAYATMWRIYQAGEPPRPFAVPSIAPSPVFSGQG